MPDWLSFDKLGLYMPQNMALASEWNHVERSFEGNPTKLAMLMIYCDSCIGLYEANKDG